MTKALLLGVVASLNCLDHLGAAPLPTQPAYAFTHATLIDGTGSKAQQDVTILVVGEKIVGVGHIPLPDGANEVNAAGKFIIPGLWDMHVHVAGVTADPKWSRDTLLPLLVANGITGIRDMGGDLESLQRWRAEIEAGEVIGPRIIAAGPMLDGGKPQPPDMLAVTSAAEGRAAVVSLKARAADFIKVLSRLDRESYFAIADEAKKQRIPFVGHVPDAITASEASAAGQKSIEHIMYSNLSFDCSNREDELRKQRAAAAEHHDQNAATAIRNAANESFSSNKAAALCRTLNDNGTWLVPTLVGTLTTSRQRDASTREDYRFNYLPASLRKQWSAEEIAKNVTPSVANWLRQQSDNDVTLARFFHNAGVRMLAGSDSLDPFNFPGSSLHEELGLFVRAGFTPMEALQAATLQPARFLDADHNGGWGTIQPGRSADMILLDADPLIDIANTQKISAVVLRGRCLNRQALDQLLLAAQVFANAVK